MCARPASAQRLEEDKHDASLRATAGLTPIVRAPDRPRPVGRSAGSARTMAGAARGRGARFAPAHGLGNLAWPTASPDLSDRVAQVLKPYFDQDQIPGISVAIVTDGQVALAQGYGLSNVATGAPVAADTRFDIGSVTKTFTAIGVLLLYQESQGTSHPLDLNAPISEYLNNTPSFKLPRKWAGVTTMELLNMTSGIGNGPSTLPWQAQVTSIAKHPLLFAPGTKTFYSDTNFDLLGELIEQRTGEKYGTFIQNQILEPLGMSETQELGRSATVPNQAVGYNASRHGRWPKAKVQNGPEMYAAAGMVSTAQDMATYMTALLSGRLLDPATYQLDVDLDTDAAIRGESPLQLRARPGMGYGDRHERRAHQGHQGRVGPRIHLRDHPLPQLGQRSLRLHQHQSSRQSGCEPRHRLAGGRVGRRRDLSDVDAGSLGGLKLRGAKGWMTGFEPAIPRSTIWCLNR